VKRRGIDRPRMDRSQKPKECSVDGAQYKTKTLNQIEYSVLGSETTPLDLVQRVLQSHSHAGRRRDTQVLQEKEYDYLRPQTERVCGDWLIRPTVVIGRQDQE
jgi:hypothetical protein